jgi:hypothetical protein
MSLRSIRSSAFAGSLGRNVVALVVFWLTGLTFIRIGERLLGGWPASTLGELGALLLGVVLALRLGAKVTAYFLTALTAYSASENAIRLYFGIRAAQGAATHLAVMGAGLIGVILGALLATHDGRANRLREAPAGTGDSQRDTVDVGGSAAHSKAAGRNAVASAQPVAHTAMTCPDVQPTRVRELSMTVYSNGSL